MSRARNDLHLDDERYISWLKTQRKFPSDELYKQYVAEINQNSQGTPSLPSERTAIQARKIWTDVVYETYKMNEALVQSKNIKQAVIKRIEKLNYSMRAEVIYERMISLLRYNSAIVLTFDATHLAKDLTSFQTLNVREKGSHNFVDHTSNAYATDRDSCEKKLYQHLNDNLKNSFFSNLSALPKYAALFILDRNQTIEPSTYGASFIVLQDFVKLNSLYMPADTFQKYKTCQLSTYHHFELFLLQCNKAKFNALVAKVVRGVLPADFAQSGDKDTLDAYFEASIPAINFFDSHFVQHIHINSNEYRLNQQEKDALTHLNLAFSNEKVSPYIRLCKQFMDAVYANDVNTVEKLLSPLPVLARITNGNGLEPIALAPDAVKQKLMQMGVRQHAHSVFSKLKCDNEYENDLTKIIKSDNLNEFFKFRDFIGPAIIDNYQSLDGKTLIYLAAENGAITILTELISKNLEINSFSHAGITPLMAAVWNNHYKCVEALVNTGRADLDSKMPGGHTALINAVEQKNCHVNIVRLLTNAPGSEKIINKARNVDSKSALYIAASLGYTEKLDVLLDYPAIDITPATIQAAEKNGHRDAARMLTESQKLFKAINNLTSDGINHLRTEAVDKLKSHLKNKTVKRHLIKLEYENFIKKDTLYSRLINMKTSLQTSLELSQKFLSSYPDLAVISKIKDSQTSLDNQLIDSFKNPTGIIESSIKTVHKLIDDTRKLALLLNDIDNEINKYAIETPERKILEKLKKFTIDSFNSDLFSFESSQQKLQFILKANNILHKIQNTIPQQISHFNIADSRNERFLKLKNALLAIYEKDNFENQLDAIAVELIALQKLDSIVEDLPALQGHAEWPDILIAAFTSQINLTYSSNLLEINKKIIEFTTLKSSELGLLVAIYNMINAIISNVSLTAEPVITHLKEQQNNRFKKFIENSHFLNPNLITHFHVQIINEINSLNQFISLANKIEFAKEQFCSAFDRHFARNTCYDILLNNIVETFNKDIHSFIHFYKLFNQKIDDLNQANLKIELLDNFNINEIITPQAMANIANHIQAIYFNQTKNIDLFVDTLLTIWPSIFQLRKNIITLQKHSNSSSSQESNEENIIKLLYDELMQKFNVYIEQGDYLDKDKTSQLIAFCNTQLAKANSEIFKPYFFFCFFKQNKSADLIDQVKIDLESLDKGVMHSLLLKR